MSNVGLLPAAGLGTRLNLSFPKELLEVENKALIDFSIENYISSGISKIVVIIRQGKESIQRYLINKYENINFVFVYQNPPYGNLVDAIRSALTEIKGCYVHLALADTVLYPSPYDLTPTKDIVLHCFKANDSEWRHYGCLHEDSRLIVDKPEKYVGNLCWGAISWPPEFSLHLTNQADFTEALNTFGFTAVHSIESYKDHGLVKKESMKQVKFNHITMPSSGCSR